jgi:hypothetical protein
MAEHCAAKAAALGGKRCFFAAREYIDLAKRYMPDAPGIDNLARRYAFVPALPSHLAVFTRTTLPKAEALEGHKHNRTADASALNDFFASGLDTALASFASKLATIRAPGAEDKARLGRELVSWIDHATKKRWTGRAARKGCRLGRFVTQAEARLKKLGFEKRPLSPRSTAERWLDPSELLLADAKAAFSAEKKRVMAGKLKALNRDIDVEEQSDPSPFETVLGIRLTKLRSNHFLVEAPFPTQDVKLCLAVQEAGFETLLKCMGIEDPGRLDEPVKSVVLGSRELYRRFVLEMTDKSDKEKEFVSTRTGSSYDFTRGYWVSSRKEMDALLRDNLIACPSIFVLSRFGFKKPPLWVKQGLQARLTLITTDGLRT